MRRTESVDENVEHKILRAPRRHLSVEGEREHHIGAEVGDEPRLGAKRRQPERFRRRPEELLRMRFERKDTEKTTALFREPARRGDQRLVTQMHAVEVADRNDRALVGIWHVAKVAEDAHGRLVLQLLRDGAITRASPSTTVVSLTLQTQSNITRRFSAFTSRTVQVVTTVSPIRTGARKRVVALMKIVPGPGICMPRTVEI